MEPEEVSELKGQIEKVDHVTSVVWYDSLLGSNIPIEFLPTCLYEKFNKGDTTLMAVFFDTSTSADETMNAITSIRRIAGSKCFVTGMSAMVTDLKNLCEKEEPIYVGIAVLCSVAVMTLFLDSFVIPLVFLASIGMAILLNLGTANRSRNSPTTKNTPWPRRSQPPSLPLSAVLSPRLRASLPSAS